MAVYQTGGYQVKPSAVNKVKEAIKEFVEYVEANEPGTRMYLAWQQRDDPTRFLHLFIFEDAAAAARHGESEEVRKFESVYGPELVGGDVVFTDYEMVAGKLPGGTGEAHSKTRRRGIGPGTSPQHAIKLAGTAAILRFSLWAESSSSLLCRRRSKLAANFLLGGRPWPENLHWAPLF